MSDRVMDDVVEFPTDCEACGTRLESGMVGIPEASIGNEPALPSTTVFELFCPNTECDANKPQQHPAADAPGSLGGDNGGG